MKHYRFYQEFADKGRTLPTGNVVAAITGNGVFTSEGVACYEAIVALLADANSPVCGGSASLNYLARQCKRISEAKAREIHPNLFQRLDRDAAAA